MSAKKTSLSRSLTPQTDKAKVKKAAAAAPLSRKPHSTKADLAISAKAAVPTTTPAKKEKQKPYVAPQADVDASAAAVATDTVPEPPKVKKVKAPKEPKAPRESRSGMIVDMLLAQNSTDEDIYMAVAAKFGEFAKNQISICRCDLNDAKHPKYKAKKEAAGFDVSKGKIIQLIPAPEETPKAVA